MPTLTEPPLATVPADVEAIVERAEALVQQLTPEQRRREPRDGAWSVDAVLEHVVLTNASYLQRMRRLIERHQADPPPVEPVHWEPTFVGRLLLRGLDPASRRRMPAPNAVRPTTVKGDPLPRFRASMLEVAELAKRAATLDLNALRLSSPFAKMLKLNLGDAFAILVVHARRHLVQIEGLVPQVA
jgi:hypothetical protein